MKDILVLLALFMIFVTTGVIIYKFAGSVYFTILKIMQKLFRKSVDK